MWYAIGGVILALLYINFVYIPRKGSKFKINHKNDWKGANDNVAEK